MAKDYDDELYWGILNSIIADKRATLHPHLRRVHSDHGFKLKKNDSEIIGECFLLEELMDAVSQAPEEAVLYHLDGRNDFAAWIRDIVGDQKLSRDLELLKPSEDSEVKAKLVQALDSRIRSLKSDSVNLIFD